MSVLEGWELVPGKALTFLKVMSTFLRLKSLKRVSEAPLKYRRSRFLCDANATSTETCPLARGVDMTGLNLRLSLCQNVR